jgi:hypothetical protein
MATMLIASLVKLAQRGSRWDAAYFVVARRRSDVSPHSSSTAARDPGQSGAN